ncbi:MAG TPA: ribosome small subunit-dependent GTPase A [Caldisericia bacterium]|nr:ribosome small subunit-dependent GTPase A [Caldisericia bacterium]HPF49208.1 ribosome small subunit-dependent GTPase A [Caldisericia bacterium]HPI84112.1 ribosome small subunit-dependent GTPase A [Caldisericia bacterium]HPQ93370.1 ribosome small subunit-dependent GTPase A [Caldisericia bacterium]HRV75248.1 ribosome small subunit-dependent GTPase A [Caldisericia bacterium]
MNNKHENTNQGLVTRKTHGIYTVKTNGTDYLCRISNKLRKELIYPKESNESLRRRVVAVRDISVVDPIAVGDFVEFKVAKEDGKGVIDQVLPRRNSMSRLGAGRKPVEQVIVANIDQALVVASSAFPKTHFFTIDRYLADATVSDIPAVIVVTKVDLCELADVRNEFKLYEDIGYRVIYTSSNENIGVDEVKELLLGKTSVMLGMSGVGKSSLLNAIEPGLGIKVREVHQKTGEGMHTTTHLEMHFLESGGGIIDTPGMREFGVWRAKKMDMANLFVEMRPYITNCQFGNSCSHLTEPGCGLLEAVSAGKVSESRYESFKKLTIGTEPVAKFHMRKKLSRHIENRVERNTEIMLERYESKE